MCVNIGLKIWSNSSEKLEHFTLKNGIAKMVICQKLIYWNLDQFLKKEAINFVCLDIFSLGILFPSLM